MGGGGPSRFDAPKEPSYKEHRCEAVFQSSDGEQAILPCQIVTSPGPLHPLWTVLEGIFQLCT